MYFYDTCALLNDLDTAFKQPFALSTITFQELEEIKTSRHKDEEIKLRARKLLNLLKDNRDRYFISAYCEEELYNLKEKHGSMFIENNDNKIISCAWHYQTYVAEDIIFRTDDIACAFMAQIAGLKVETSQPLPPLYKGYTILTLGSDEAIADFYQNIENEYTGLPLNENEYLLIETNNTITDIYKYKNKKLNKIHYPCFDSKMFGRVKPQDTIQHIAMDCLKTNQVTMLKGPAGSGKSMLSMAYLFDQLERGKIDKIIIFCNTVAVAGAAKLGYYPGDKNQKLLDSQIGNFLSSKLGDKTIVEELIADGKIVLVPLADCRGYDTTGMNAGIYVTEAQNLDIELLKLILQRIGEDSICIIEGDDLSQVDSAIYAGSRNGMKRMSKVFRGQDFYGEVTLEKIHRSRIAEVAQEM